MRIKVHKNVFFYIGFSSLLIKYAMASSVYPFEDVAGYSLVIIGLIFYMIKIVLTKNYTRHEIRLILIIAIICMMVFIKSGDDILLITLITGVAMRKVNFKTVVKLWTFLYIAIFFWVILRSFIDGQALTAFINNDRYNGLTTITIERYCFGFSHPNAFHGIFLKIACGLLLLNNSLLMCFIIEVVNILIYMQSVSRAGFFSTTLLVIGLFILRSHSELFMKRITKNIVIFTELSIIFLNIFVVYTYGNYQLFILLDSYMTGRFSLASRIQRIVPLSILGRNIFDYNVPFSIDNGIWTVILSFGIATFVMFTIMYIYALSRFVELGYYVAVVMILVNTLYSYCEMSFGHLYSSMALIITFYMIFNQNAEMKLRAQKSTIDLSEEFSSETLIEERSTDEDKYMFC